MKKIVPGSLGFILLSILSGSAMAADLSTRPPIHTKAPMMAPGFNWTGIYIGINGGGGWGASRFDFPGLGTTTGDSSTSGALVGGTIGVNWQTSNVVFGLEGDGDWVNFKGSSACPIATFTCATSDTWLATARARLGIAANDWLLYITGGGAFGDVQIGVTGPVTFAGQTVNRSGWTVGGGAEYGLAPGWSVKAEYLHVDLGTAGCSIPNCSAFSSVNVPFRTEIVRAGLNYRFNWGGSPIMAKY
jgi:outer membrane immunogenic protein